MRPVIGITSDCNLTSQADTQEKGSQKYPLFGYCLRPTYINAVTEAGGLALILPIILEKDALEQMAQMIQGLLISGGGHDLDPSLYGEVVTAPLGEINPDRSSFELALAKRMLEMSKPVLGICNGLQVINVASGGTLHQDIPSQVKGSLPHQQKGSRREKAHEVYILPDSQLRAVLATERIWVNSLHHQAVKGLGKGFRVNAVAADGIIEGIEMIEGPFVMGVQWHPEDLVEADPKMQALFSVFVQSASQRL